jgi:predicted CXXCH cytochrome family protein
LKIRTYRVPALAATAALIVVIGVATRVGGQSVPAPQPAAGYVGSETCAGCHDAESAQYTNSSHGRLAPHELRGARSGCESCHGPGARHAESGDPADILRFDDMPASQASQACATCHLKDRAQHWPGSEHAMQQVACSGCHRIHQSRQLSRVAGALEGMPAAHANAPAPKGSLLKPEPELCFTCHPEKRGKMNASSRHPIREGRMTCSSCHDVHGTGQANSLVKSAERPNDLCFTCHSKHQGPFIFEHAPVEESCMTCHDPHGTVANNLLKQGEPFLCLQCHEMHFHNARVAPATPFALPAGGSANPNGASGFQRAFGTRCTTCHTRIHGSDKPSTGISGGGKALIR